MVDGYSPIPFADLWDQFPFIERGLRGEIGLSDLFAQHNEHRIALARLQFLVDYGLFDGTSVFLFGAIAAASLLLALGFAAAVWIDTHDRVLALGALSVAVTATMSPAGIENLTWSFQVAFVQVFLFATVAILALVMAAHSTTTSRRGVWAAVAVAAVAGVAATYSMANGLIVWPILVLLALVLGLDRRLTAAVATVGVLSIGLYLWSFEFSPRGNLSDPVGLVHFTAVYLGSVVWGAGSAPAALVGATGLILFPVLCALCWRGRSGRSVAVPFGAGVAAFAVLTAAETAVGRLDLGGTAQALSSRYSIGSATFWLALLVGLVPLVRERARSAPVVPVRLPGGRRSGRSLRRISDAPDRHVSAGCHVRARADGRRVPLRCRGPFATCPRRPGRLRRSGGAALDGDRATGPVGAWRHGRRDAGRPDRDHGPLAVAVARSRRRYRSRRASGSRAGSMRLRAEATSRNLVVLDGTGGRNGVGLAGAYRPEAQTSGASSGWRGFVAYAPGRPTSFDVVLLDQGGVDAVCRLPAEQAG